MGTVSQNERESGKRNGAPSGKAPITAHPAFPFVVAMWFAALLGLGSLILPVALFERMIDASGIAAFVTAATPPLGFTARGVIAIAFTLLGAAIGLFAARRIAPAALGAPRRRSLLPEENSARQPLNAREELGSDSFDSVASFASARRRALSGAEESGRSDFLQVAPVPGEDDRHGFAFRDQSEESDQGINLQYDHIRAPQRKAQAILRPETEAHEEPLDLGECAEFTEDQALSLHDAPQQDTAKKIEMSEIRNFEPINISPSEHDMPTAEPLPFSPPSMARAAHSREEMNYAVERQEFQPPRDEPQRFAAPVTTPEAETTAPEMETFAPENEMAAPETAAAGMAEQVSLQALARANTVDGVATGTAEPGLVQLVEKLGATLEKHRKWSAQRSEKDDAAARFPRAVADAVADGDSSTRVRTIGDFDVADPGDAASAMAAFFADQPTADEPADEFAAETGLNVPERQEFILPAQDDQALAGKRLRAFAGLAKIEDDFDDDDDDDEAARLAASFTLPVARDETPPAAPVPSVPEAHFVELTDEAADDTPTEAEDYSSLIAMKNPFLKNQPEFVRVEEPEPESEQAAVVFPHEEASVARPFDRPASVPQSAPTSANEAAPQRPVGARDDHDRVLREALNNLQRIGKLA